MKNDDLKEVKINEWIWIIFVILSLANIYGDELEKNTLNQNHIHNKKAKNIFLITATIALIIYFYFTVHSYNKLKKTKMQNTYLQEINFIGNTLVFLGALLLIYFSINNKNEITTELP